MKWSVESIKTRYEFSANGKSNSLPQTINLSRIGNILTEIVRRGPKFTYMMQSLLSYAQVFEEVYDVRFIGVGIVKIVDDMMFSI